jgi:hypothetical protein
MPIVLVLLALSTAALAACGYGMRVPTDAEVAALEPAMNGLPDVTAAEVTYNRIVDMLYARVDLDEDINPDSAATTVLGIVDLLRVEAFAEVRGSLTVTVGVGHAESAFSHPPVQLEIDFPNPPATETLADEARLWRELSTRFSRVAVDVDTDESGDVRGRGVSVRGPGPSEAAVDALLELERLPWPRTTEPSVWWVYADGLSLGSEAGFPPSRGVEAMRALGGLGGLVAPDDYAGVGVQWDGTSGCLRAGVAVLLAEFRNLPTDELDAGTMRDRAARLTDESLKRLDASGVPYSFRAYVPGSGDSGSGASDSDLDFLDVDRCGTGSGW